jgi:hypothetical protein
LQGICQYLGNSFNSVGTLIAAYADDFSSAEDLDDFVFKFTKVTDQSVTFFRETKSEV